MKYTLLIDLARVLVFPKNKSYKGDLNPLYAEKSKEKDFTAEDYLLFNTELLDYLREIAGKCEIYMYTSGTMQEDRIVQYYIEGIFRDIFSAEKMNMNKKDFKSYIKILRVLKKKPEEVMFVDDNKANIEAAIEAGISGILYESNEKLKAALQSYIS